MDIPAAIAAASERSLVPDLAALEQLGRLAAHVVHAGIAGDVVELGVFRGGSAGILGQACIDTGRRLWLYDTWAGIPAAGLHDNPRALALTGKMAASREDARSHVLSLGIPEPEIVQGDFTRTVHARAPEHIAILHLDGDWYESVLVPLRALYDRVSDGGAIVFDDFGYWEGARRAFYVFCRERNLEPLLERAGRSQAWFIKGREHNRPGLAELWHE